jgi:hypothetical protein
MGMFKDSIVHLNPRFFTEKESILLEQGCLKASLFCYKTGVAAIRVTNGRGEAVILPYQGQQIWRCRFDGRDLHMKSIFDEPEPTQDYLRTYGGLFIHCGATTMGVPSALDTHPLHGELPNAPYQEAFLKHGHNENGHFIAVGGKYCHRVAFNHHYIAQPLVQIYENSTLLDVSMSITNLRHTDMDVMYLAHINFRPVDHAELTYSAPYDAEHIKVNVNVPAHIKSNVPIEEFTEFLHRLKADPSLHHTIDPTAHFDPEVVMAIKYQADEEGFAHSLQVHPDGYAHYVRHRPDQLDNAIRWIARNQCEDAMGLVLPANAGVEGYLAEKAASRVKILTPNMQVSFEMRTGLLLPEEAKQVKWKISQIITHTEGQNDT